MSVASVPNFAELPKTRNDTGALVRCRQLWPSASAFRRFRDNSRNGGGVMETKAKPTLEEVMAYVEEQIPHAIRKYALELPEELRDEVAQEARVRVWRTYERIEASGWRSFVQRHCNGAVFDYKRSGNGFKEYGYTQADVEDAAEEDLNKKDVAELKPEEAESLGVAVESEDSGDIEEQAETETQVLTSMDEESPVVAKRKRRSAMRLRHRVAVEKEDGGYLDAEETLGLHGVFNAPDDEGSIKPRWSLLEKLAGDEVGFDLLLAVQVGLLKFTQEELSRYYGVTRERLSQRIKEFVTKLDAPSHLHSRVVCQHIYALGLSAEFGLPDVDNGYGHDLHPVDLYDPESAAKLLRARFPGLFSDETKMARPNYAHELGLKPNGARVIDLNDETDQGKFPGFLN